MKDVKKLLERASRPQKISIDLHRFYVGKIETVPKCRISSYDDFSVWYTPGVSAPCMEIHRFKDASFELTNRGNTVAVVSDGSRVLGLGNIGPEAAMPVMEGKAILYKYLGGVDAFPVCLRTTDAEEIIKTVKYLEPSFGGINLEDIEQPKCFYILDRLRAEMDIPVWHDDQQGTATVVLAGFINALKIVKKKIDKIRVTMLGAGAANIAIARLLFKAGLDPAKTILLDSKGTLHKGREELKEKYKEKWEMCQITNERQIAGGIPEALEGADVFIGMSTPGPDVVKKEWIKKMNKDAIVFACANPVPEIWPWEAKEAGARIVATGRSDFPNQINNSLGFPGIFRGVLDVKGKTISDEMCIEAAYALAEYAQKKGINENYIIPKMSEWKAYVEEAVRVGLKAIKDGVARIKLSKEELYKKAEDMIKRARKEVELFMKSGLIKKSPKKLEL
jgi:malate dehydrogenase (oxaloacetate-decarboxylating)